TSVGSLYRSVRKRRLACSVRHRLIYRCLVRSCSLNAEKYSQLASFIWSVADLLRGDFKQSQYGRIILPFTLLRRMECVLAPTKEAVLRAAREHQSKPD